MQGPQSARRARGARSTSSAHTPTAFTLIELLVVVAIIVVLIALLLPSLNAARAQAKMTTCMSNHKQIMMALGMYAHENSGYLPPSVLVDAYPTPTPHLVSYAWYAQRFAGGYLGTQTDAPYYTTVKAMFCTEIDPRQVAYQPAGIYAGAFGIGINLYANNGSLTGGRLFWKQATTPTSVDDVTWTPANPRVFRFTQLNAAGRIIVLAESQAQAGGSPATQWACYYVGDTAGFAGSGNSTYGPSMATAYRHNRKTLVSFGDSHVEPFASAQADGPSLGTHQNQGLHQAFRNGTVTHQGGE